MDLESLRNWNLLAWIPCVSGSLDFLRFNVHSIQRQQQDNTDFPISASYINEHDISRFENRLRYCVASTVYDWQDSTDADSDVETSGKFRVITLSQTNDDGQLEGDAFLVLQDYLDQFDEFLTSVLKPMQSLEYDIAQYQREIAENLYSPKFKLEASEVGERMTHIKSSIHAFYKTHLGNHLFHVKYQINGNGITLLKYQDNLGVDRVDDKSDPQLIERRKHHKFVIEKTTFTFLKTILHKHKHHKDSEDNITSVHTIDHSNPRKTALRLVEDLQKTAVEIKNKEIEKELITDHYFDGFIAYCNSLVLSLSQINLIKKKEAKHFKAFFNNMLKSWRSISERNAAQKEAREKGTIEFFQLTSLFVAALALLLFTFSRYSSKQSVLLEQSANNVEQHWMLTLFKQRAWELDFVFFVFVGVLFAIGLRQATNPFSPMRRLSTFAVQSKYFNIAALRTVLTLIIAVASITMVRLMYLANFAN